MAVADFISRNRTIECAFFHHGTEVSKQAARFVRLYCAKRGWTLYIQPITKDKPTDLSTEEHWRNERYKFLDSFNRPVITAHHLDDCVETYLWSSMHGTAKLIPYDRNNIIRPFLTTTKQELVRWAEQHNVPWQEDVSNVDTKYMRNYIRKEIMPRALVVNPGLKKVILKKLNTKLKETND